jgi:hypothetical protein
MKVGSSESKDEVDSEEKISQSDSSEYREESTIHPQVGVVGESRNILQLFIRLGSADCVGRDLA